MFEWFMVHHGEKLSLRANTEWVTASPVALLALLTDLPRSLNHSGESKITHLVIRIYGALILAQAWITWSARKCDAQIRRALIQVHGFEQNVGKDGCQTCHTVQAYWFCFTLTALALLRAQVTP